MMRKAELEARRVLAMPAGRDVDIEVAEKVMGWTYLPDYGRWVMPGNGRWVANVQEFSSDIRAAWRVVEKMLASRWSCNIGAENYESARARRVVFSEYGGVWVQCEAEAETVELAICRAALLAVGGES